MAERADASREYLFDCERNARILLYSTVRLSKKCVRGHTPHLAAGVCVYMTSRRPRLFYGWLIVFVSALGLFLGAPLCIFSFSVFFKPLVGDFHASRAAVSFAFSLLIL